MNCWNLQRFLNRCPVHSFTLCSHTLGQNPIIDFWKSVPHLTTDFRPLPRLEIEKNYRKYLCDSDKECLGSYSFTNLAEMGFWHFLKSRGSRNRQILRKLWPHLPAHLFQGFWVEVWNGHICGKGQILAGLMCMRIRWFGTNKSILFRYSRMNQNSCEGFEVGLGISWTNADSQ